MDAATLSRTVDNLTDGRIAKAMLVKRGGGEHNTHRWIKVRKANSSVVKMSGVGQPQMQGTIPVAELKKELEIAILEKEAGMGGSPATVGSTGFTPTFGAQPKKKKEAIPC